MALVVVDASALAALVFGEGEADDVAARLRGAELAAPDLLPYELANVAAVKVRRRLMSPVMAGKALQLARRLDVRLHAVAATAAFEAASQSGLTAYDSAYLWLARALRAELVTLDRGLAAAAREEP